MRSASVVVLTAALSLAFFGCSSDRNAIEKRLSSLSEDISRVQAENDRLGERVDALEVKGTAKAPKAAPVEAPLDRQPLKVVKLVPGGGDAATESEPSDLSPEERPDAPGTRPVIRLRGGGKEARAEEARSGSPVARQSEEAK